MINFSFSRKEIEDIFYSTVAIGFIFAWGQGFSLMNLFIMTAIVAVSFLPHEMAHKYVAVKYGCFAQYQMWKEGLLIAVVMTVLFGFAIIAPGAVVIYSAYRNRYGVTQVNLGARENALISAAGPLANILVALFFLPLASQSVFGTVVYINSFLALFNLLPFPPLDGSKIIWYNILMWGAMVAAAFVLLSFA